MKDNKKYSRKKMVLGLGTAAWEAFVLWLILRTGFSHTLENASVFFGENSWLIIRMAIFILAMGVFMEILTFPVKIYSGYVVEHQFHLSHQSMGQWAKQHYKGLVLTLALSWVLLTGFYTILKYAPDNWWWIAALIWIGVSLLLNRLFPVIVIPLFYKLTPLEDETLTARLREMAEKKGVEIEQVMRVDFSKDTVKVNAAVTGLGKKKKIILADNLLEEFSEDEIAVVFAHEIGHHYYGHTIKRILEEIFLTGIGFFLASRILPGILPEFQISQLENLSSIPLFLLAASIYGFLLNPVQNTISRYYERQADTFALKTTRLREAFISAMERLRDMNLANPEPHPVVEKLLYSHPSIQRRIHLAKNIEL